MARIAIMMADGCEEIEGLAVVDLLRRAKIDIDMISISDEIKITGSHGICFLADKTIDEFVDTDYDGIVLPGGLTGTNNLANSVEVCDEIKTFHADGKLVSAICAAPSVLAKCGVLKGRRAICYPSFEETISAEGAILTHEAAVTDGNVITSRGMGTAIDFGLAIVSYIIDKKAADELAEKIVFKR